MELFLQTFLISPLTSWKNDTIIVLNIYLTIYIIKYFIERTTDMAPKNKFTREEMVAAAVQIVRKNGAASLTAKSLAEELSTSTQPVFTCFGTMDTAKAEVYAAAERLFDDYLADGLKEKISFLGFGMAEIISLEMEKGKKAIRLDTLASNIPAQHMYEKLGFVDLVNSYFLSKGGIRWTGR